MHLIICIIITAVFITMGHPNLGWDKQREWRSRITNNLIFFHILSSSIADGNSQNPAISCAKLGWPMVMKMAVSTWSHLRILSHMSWIHPITTSTRTCRCILCAEVHASHLSMLMSKWTCALSCILDALTYTEHHHLCIKASIHFIVYKQMYDVCTCIISQ
jgi:hypothetical protein